MKIRFGIKGTELLLIAAIQPSLSAFVWFDEPVGGCLDGFNDLFILNITTFDACKLECEERRGSLPCRSVDYSISHGRCILSSSSKHENPDAMRDISSCGMVQHSTITGPAPSTGDCQYIVDSDYNGNDIEGVPQVLTAEDCCNLCKVRWGCRAWTYNPSNDLCWLKFEAGNPIASMSAVAGSILHECYLKSKAENLGTLVGQVTGAIQNDECGTFAMVDDMKIDRSVVTMTTPSGIQDARSCGKECLKIYQCKSAEYNATDTKCHLSSQHPSTNASSFPANSDPAVQLLYRMK